MNPQTLNPYVYCVNNPLKYIDPDGEWHIMRDDHRKGGWMDASDWLKVLGLAVLAVACCASGGAAAALTFAGLFIEGGGWALDAREDDEYEDLIEDLIDLINEMIAEGNYDYEDLKEIIKDIEKENGLEEETLSSRIKFPEEKSSDDENSTSDGSISSNPSIDSDDSSEEDLSEYWERFKDHAI